MKIINKKYIVNEDIKEKEIRVINTDGTQLGILKTAEAQKLAEKQIRLCNISPGAKPPVCKIMDLG